MQIAARMRRMISAFGVGEEVYRSLAILDFSYFRLVLVLILQLLVIALQKSSLVAFVPC